MKTLKAFTLTLLIAFVWLTPDLVSHPKLADTLYDHDNPMNPGGHRQTFQDFEGMAEHCSSPPPQC